MSTVIETDEQPGTRPERRPTGRSVLMCRPEHFTVGYSDQPVDGPGRARPTPRLALQQWQALYDTYLAPRPRRPAHRPDRGPARHGLRRQRRLRHRRHRLRREVPLPRAPARGPGVHGLVPRRRLRRARARGGQRGRGRLPARRRHDPRRHRLPLRLATATTSSARIFGREVVTPQLVDPASTTSTPRSPCSTRRPAAEEQHRLPAERVRRGVRQAILARALPRRDPS